MHERDKKKEREQKGGRVRGSEGRERKVYFARHCSKKSICQSIHIFMRKDLFNTFLYNHNKESQDSQPRPTDL